jgi:hypothetical protein
MNTVYPNFATRRAEFVARIRAINESPTETLLRIGAPFDILTAPGGELGEPLDVRRLQIEEALRDEFMDKATAFELLDELGEIIANQEKE